MPCDRAAGNLVFWLAVLDQRDERLAEDGEKGLDVQNNSMIVKELQTHLSAHF